MFAFGGNITWCGLHESCRQSKSKSLVDIIMSKNIMMMLAFALMMMFVFCFNDDARHNDDDYDGLAFI